MSDQYLGEIRTLGFNFAPLGWALCNGQTLPISQYAALFSLLGTAYGGNGTTTFALPDLQGQAPMHWGNGTGLSSYVVGEQSGSTTVTLSTSQMPAHNHSIQVSGATTGNTADPGSSVWLGDASPGHPYATSSTPNTTLAQNAIGSVGGNQPHANQQPFLVINFSIALSGIFPPRS
jgi:microcystin-dependent protein